MGFNLPGFNSGGSAPTVEDGLALLRFDGVERKEHPDWAGTDKFGKEDDGVRLHWQFTLLDDDHAVVYEEGDPVELETLTRTATGERSNAFALFSGIATAAEVEAYKAGTLTEEQSEGMLGRIVNGKVAHNGKGWPYVESVIGIAKPKKGK